MKKSFGLLVLASALLFSGCFSELAVPEKISLKTDAEYSFTVASFDSAKDEKLDMSSMFDLGKLLDGAGTGNSATGFQVYKYNDGSSENQQYLVNMPLSDIDLNLGETFSQMDFAKVMESMSIEQKFTIPDVSNVDKTEKVPLDSVNEKINNSLAIGGAYYGSPVSVPDQLTNFFTSLSYKSGKIKVTAGDPDYNGGVLPNITKRNINATIILKSNGVEVSRASIENGYGELPLNEVTLSSPITVEFENPSDSYFSFKGEIDSASKVKSVTGLTLASTNGQDFSVDTEITIPFNISNIEDCVINEGSARVAITGGSGYINSYTLNATGGFTANFTAGTPEVSLIDTPLHNEDIKVSANVKLRFSNSNVDFDNPPIVNAKVNVAKITATIALPEGFKNEIDQKTDVPSDITAFVKSITWDKIGFKITGKNTLPAGNDVSISTFTSNFLSISISTPISITAGGAPVNKEVVKTGHITDFTPVDGNGDGVVDPIQIDVKGTIDVPGDAANKKLTISQVVPGTEYELSVKVEPILEWNTATINANGFSYDGDMNTGLNFSEMFNQLKDMFGVDVGNSIEISTLPVYLYGAFPELSAGYMPTFKGVIKAYYADDDGNPTSDAEYLLGAKGAGADTQALFELSPVPNFTFNQSEEITNKFGTATADLKDLMNTDNASGKLNVNYNIGLTSSTGTPTIAVDQERFNQLQQAGDTKISMGIMMILTTKFNVTQDIVLDISELMNSSDDDGSSDPATPTPTPTDKERDLFSRESADAFDDMEKYIDVVEKVSVVISDVELPIKTSKMSFEMVDPTNSTKKYCSSAIEAGKSISIDLNPSEVLEVYPFEPKMNFIIGQGEFGLPRTMKTAGKIKFKVKTNGTVDIWENDNGGKN